jgi:hypothetical protein
MKTPAPAVEHFYSVQAASLLLGLSTKTVLVKLKAGDLGRGVVNLGGSQRPDYRIPASGLNGYLNSRRVFSETPAPIATRSVGELRRKSRSP